MSATREYALRFVTAAFQHPTPVTTDPDIDAACATLCHGVLQPEECDPILTKALQDSRVKEVVCGEFAEGQPMVRPLLQTHCPNLPPAPQPLEVRGVMLEDESSITVRPWILVLALTITILITLLCTFMVKGHYAAQLAATPPIPKQSPVAPSQ